ncbi:MAG: hypothetical protein PHG65_03340 [Kiritimatiellae bacterium]|nr:hypothetical protein [Kiritimatiellia bacterium]
MNIAAYITIRSDYFLRHVSQLVPRGIPLQLLPLHEWLLEAQTPPTEAHWRAYLDEVFTKNRPDVLWTYNRPDEVTEEAARFHRIPILSQENLGRTPFALPMLFPLNADLQNTARSMNLTDALCTAQMKRGAPLDITLAFSLSCFHAVEAIPAVLERMRQGNHLVPLATYWRTSSALASHGSLLRLVLNALEALDVDWRLHVRLHPRYLQRYAAETEWIHAAKRSDILLDERSIEACLDETDIMICTTSNIGADALRAGCRVITLESRAFYAHPQLTECPRNVGGLADALRHAVQETREKGRVQSAALRALLTLAEGPLACTCEPAQPDDTTKLLCALNEGTGLPALASRETKQR